MINPSTSRTRGIVLSLAAQLHGLHALAPTPFRPISR